MPDGSERVAQRVCDVPIGYLPMIWPRVEHFIADALVIDECGRYLPIDIYQEAASGRLRLWVSWDRDAQEFDAAGVTEIIQFPRCRECRVWLLAGKGMHAWWREMCEMVEAYARFERCSHLAAHGRPGWERISGSKRAGFDLIKRLI